MALKKVHLSDQDVQFLRELIFQNLDECGNELKSYPEGVTTGSIMRKGFLKKISQLQSVIDAIPESSSEASLNRIQINSSLTLLKKKWNEINDLLEPNLNDPFYWLSISENEKESFLELDFISSLMRKLRRNSNTTPNHFNPTTELELIDKLRDCNKVMTFSVGDHFPYKAKFLSSDRKVISFRLSSPLPTMSNLAFHSYPLKDEKNDIQYGGKIKQIDSFLAELTTYRNEESLGYTETLDFLLKLLSDSSILLSTK